MSTAAHLVRFESRDETPTLAQLFQRMAAGFGAPMVFITQLVYVRPGKESVFDEFESVAIPLITKHGGELLLRLRPTPDSVVERSIDLPYEIHLVRFPNDEALAHFATDEERQRLLHLKDDSEGTSLVVRGTAT